MTGVQTCALPIYFGDWRNKKCYEVYKKSPSQCKTCKVAEIYQFGEVRVLNESGIDKNGKICHYIVHIAPLKGKEGNIDYVVEMSTDVTENTRYQKQYNLFFEMVPSYVSIIDKNYKIVRANKKFRDTFGEVKGKYCYEVYKKRKKKCRYCPASLTFKDGKEHISAEVGKTFMGEDTHYVVNTTPMSTNEDGVQLVLEIATDITDVHNLEEQLRKAHDFYATLIENADDGIIAINQHNKVEIFNQSAKKILNWNSFKKPVLNQLMQILPPEFFDEPDEIGEIVNSSEQEIKTLDDVPIPVRFNAIELKIGRASCRERV